MAAHTVHTRQAAKRKLHRAEREALAALAAEDRLFEAGDPRVIRACERRFRAQLDAMRARREFEQVIL